MMSVELIALAITEGAKVMLALSELLSHAEGLDPDEARAEANRIFDDVKIDQAIERRMLERMRTDIENGNANQAG